MANHIVVDRLAHDDGGTISSVKITDRDFAVFGLEDPPHESKIKGDTRIPCGTYPLRWRTVGKWAKRYQAKGFPGSLEICDVPNYTAVLIHVGNSKKDTAGCLLLGMSANLANKTIGNSRVACDKLYREVAADEGDWVITYYDEHE